MKWREWILVCMGVALVSFGFGAFRMKRWQDSYYHAHPNCYQLPPIPAAPAHPAKSEESKEE